MVAPTFNNAATVADVLARVRAQHLPVIIVNDGCTDDTPARLEAFASDQPTDAVIMVSHGENHGKAAALRTGFEKAASLGFTHAVTIDTDGQHDPADIPALLEAAACEPEALILGERTAAGGTPGASMLGRRMTNLAIHGSTGLWVRDSQCGLRVYPLPLIRSVPCRTCRYAFESEIITRAMWAGWQVRTVPVTNRYAPPEQRVSHFRPLWDTAHGMLLQLLLLMRELLPLPHRNTAAHGMTRRRNKPWLEWFHPAGLLEQARGDASQQTALAAGLSIGAFVGCLPIYPLQPLLAIYTARRWRLHPLAMLAGSLISLPPVGPLIVLAALFVGHTLLHFSPPDLAGFDFAWLTGSIDLWRQEPLEWLVGSYLVASIIMVLAFFAVWAILSRRPQASTGADPTAMPGPGAASK